MFTGEFVTMITRIKSAFLTSLLTVVPSLSVLAGEDTTETTTAAFSISLSGLLSTTVYSIVGIVILVLAFLIFDLLTPYKLHKELAEDQNVALGVVIAGVFVAISIIIAASVV